LRIFAKNNRKYNTSHSYCKIDADNAETHFLAISTVLACMLPELHAFKVLLYAKSESVVTSGHVTEMAVTQFDPQLLKTPFYTQTSWLYLL